jgi:phosphatidylethanolamine/phosphatidyl-N-methylethanolamine N-methyltransferase
MNQTGRMLREFLADPLGTAAVAPSSQALAHRMLEGLDFAHIQSIVEFGPGTGVFTKATLDRCTESPHPSRQFLAIERNLRLASELSENLPGGVRIVHGDAREVQSLCAQHSLPPVDLVVSGLGWPSIPQSPRDAILEATHAVLRPGGEFRTFGYHIGLCMPGAWAFRKTCSRLFASMTISPVVWGNMPPAFVYRCIKG